MLNCVGRKGDLRSAHWRGAFRQGTDLIRSNDFFPVWSRSARQILYQDNDGHIQAIDYVANGDSFSPGKPRLWLNKAVAAGNRRRFFDLAPDGKRIVTLAPPESDSEPHLKRLKRNGFIGILPGIESWFDLGGKSKTGARQGMDKVRQVSEHVNLILRYIPYIQTNFVLGLDADEGAEPFELTKRFLDMTPGAFPAYSLLTAFGRAAALNLDYQRANRVLPFPFHFLNNNQAMNVRNRPAILGLF
jgi:hypothetical protein